MQLTKQHLVLFIALLMSSVLSSQSLHNEIEALVSHAYQEGNFNGSAMVIHNDSVLYKGSFGYANEEWQVENTPETKFKIGSCTKQFTAAIMMLLAEEGKINVDSTISTYLPEYPKPAGDKITIDHLLSHRSGIPEYFAMPELQSRSYIENKPLDFIQCFWEMPLDFDPGSCFQYSNSNYFILGYIIELVAGKPYEEVLREKILEPLHMKDTGVDNATQIFPNKAYGYIKVDGEWQVAPFINSSGAYAAGAIYSTVGDLEKWTHSLLNETLLSHKSTLQLTSLHSERYGYGLGIVDLPIDGNKIRIFGHEGEIYGYRSLIHMLPEQNSVIIFLDNHNNTHLFQLAKEIIGVVGTK